VVNYFELARLVGKTTLPTNRADPLVIPFLALPFQLVLASLQQPVLVLLELEPEPKPVQR